MKNGRARKAISLFLAVGILLPSFIPDIGRAQTLDSLPEESIALESIVEIPEVTLNSTTVYPDISRIDWAQEVSLNGKSLALNSDEALNALALSNEIKDVVRSYREEKTSIDRKIFMWPWDKPEKKAVMDEGIQHAIAQILVEEGQLPADYSSLVAQDLVQSGDNVFELSELQAIDSGVLTPLDTSAEIIDITSVEAEARNLSLFEEIGMLVKKTFVQIVAMLAPERAHADVASVTEDAVAYLIEEQNPDGSWGTATSTKFITTVTAIGALISLGEVGTSTEAGVEWVADYLPGNNDYLAEQVNLYAIGTTTSTSTEDMLLSLALAQNEADGGFGYDKGYGSDAVTTAKAIQALFASDYVDTDTEDHVTASLAIHYLINTQRFDDGWGVSEIGSSPIPATAEVIEALLLWKHQSLGAIQVDDTLDPGVASLVNTQGSDGTWGGDLLNTALAYHAIKAAGETPTYQLDTVEYFESEQEGNGSFDDDIYKTAKVAKALSIATNSGQLVVSDIIPVGTLQTGTTSQFDIRISNPGNIAVDSGTLHIMADGYRYGSFDFEVNNLVVNASSTVDVSIGFPSSRKFLGNVDFKIFIEGTNNVIHSDSRYSETLSFGAATDNSTSLPMWWVAHKSVSSSGTPAISYRWALKSDSLLKDRIVMLRVKGVSTWSAIAVASTTSAVTVGSLTEGTTYEAMVGTRSASNQIFQFNTPVEVKVSSNPDTYTDGSVAGKVISIDGFVPGVGVVGSTASTTAFSDEDGTFFQENVPWGSGYVQVSNFLYESYKDDFTIADTSVTDRHVYTNKKIDTASPTVTSLAIIGEGDYVMENLEKKIIQYTFTDDIQSGGQGVVESARIYYYDPNSSNWKLITTQSGTLVGTLTYNWNIPSSLVGTGYKIKVVVRDFAGKDSAAYEWGPFEVTAGNASPSLTFTAPVAGVPATADGSYLIKWTDSDPDDNATTTFSYDPDNNPTNGNHITITDVMEDDPTNEYVWNTSGVVNGTYYLRADLSDGHNATTTVYSTGVITVDNPVCAPPVSGDWTVTESCTLTGTHTAPQSVTVNASQILTLGPGSELFIDFRNYKLLVKNTGGVLVKKTAVLRQSP